jgi:hypothetical protein
MISSPVLLSTAYLPPIPYISKFLTGAPVLIEKHENYQKQSYRNRCYIYGANGKQCLVVPVKKKHGTKTLISDVEIDYSNDWHKIHLKSIESAYRLSPFYEYYADEFGSFYRKEYRFLFTLNMDMLDCILRLVGIRKNYDTTRYWETFNDYPADFRKSIHPKIRLSRPDINFNPLPYQQVFQEKYGFIPCLSIIDLLFNEGPLALEVLGKSVMARSTGNQQGYR